MAALCAAGCLVLSACQGEPASSPESTGGPGDWAYAVLQAPLDAWGPSPRGVLTTFDGDGELTWSTELTGVQDARADTDGSLIYLAERDADTVVGTDGVVRTERVSGAGAEVAVHALAVDDAGNGVVLLNEGFADNPMGYSFLVTAFEDGEVAGEASVEGFVRAVWSCGDGWQAAVTSLTAEGLEDEQVVVGDLAATGEFTPGTTFTMPAGTEWSYDPVVPCVDGAGVVLTVESDLTSEEDQTPVLDVSLWELRSDAEPARHHLTGWSGPAADLLAHDSTVSGTELAWVSTDGQVRTVPTGGGEIRATTDLDLPSPLPVDMVLFLDEELATVALPTGDGLEVTSHRLTNGDVISRVLLDVPLDDDLHVSDLVVRGG